jgi:Holliday junction DNA helicase RuvA
MIGRLVGKVSAEDGDGATTIDVAGVGYEVTLPPGTLGRAVHHKDAVELIVHTHVREDALELFGFASLLERKVFRLLIGVPNVGPRTALAVLGHLPAPELAHAVAAQDIKTLNKIPGIGKKTAERLVLELREKLLKLGPATSGPKPPATATG